MTATVNFLQLAAVCKKEARYFDFGNPSSAECVKSLLLLSDNNSIWERILSDKNKVEEVTQTSASV